MRKRIWLVLLFIFFPLPTTSLGAQISVIYDSDGRAGSEMKTGWGWSAVIEREKFIVILDTGWDEAIFRHNLQASGYKPADIDVVVISHWHPDHIGGLKYLMKNNPRLIAYVPGSSRHQAPDDKRYFIPKGKKDLSQKMMILQTTGADYASSGVEDELSLVLRTSKGTVVVHGCAHSELRNILGKVKEYLPGKIHMTMGGMRYLNKTEAEMRVIAEDLKEIGLEKIGPAHCAVGDASTKIFREFFGKDFFYARLGAIIPLPLDNKKSEGE
jgi:7,8-dihydropterin-6-yl-methyl-4-(beta-D-ribofuranosyl)aminobenzene 5'-phosphate synthase